MLQSKRTMIWTNSERITLFAMLLDLAEISLLLCSDTLITLLKSQRYYRIQVGRIPTVSFFLSINYFICSKIKHWYKIAFQIWQSSACCVSNMCERKGMLCNLRFKGHSATAPAFWKPQLEPASWLGWTLGLSCWLSSTISVKDVSRVEFQHMSK